MEQRKPVKTLRRNPMSEYEYHHSLLDQDWAVLAHALQNLVGGVVTSL